MGVQSNGTAASYTKAKALMICWKPEENKSDKINKTLETFKKQRDMLSNELDGFNFGIESFEVDSVKPYRALFLRLHEFLKYDDQQTLLVVYYGGHGERNEDNQLVWLRDEPKASKDLRGIPQVNWSALQMLFVHECDSPVIFLLDCCYAGASAHREQSSSNVVALAATGFHDVAPVRGKNSFTTFLTKVLKEVREQEKEVNVAFLKTLISSSLNSSDMLNLRGASGRVTPDYFPFSNKSIYLKILPTRDEPVNHVHFDVEPTRPIEEPNGMAKPDTEADPSPPPQTPVRIKSRKPAVNMSPRTPQPSGRLRLSAPSPTRSATNFRGQGKALSHRHRTERARPESQPRNPRQNRYHYSPLEKNKCRVLAIHAAENPEEPITCYMKEMPQDTEKPALEYTALSWRPPEGQTVYRDSSRKTLVRPDPDWNDMIFIMEVHRKYSLTVDPSLQPALRRLRDSSDTVYIWVDQLCIDWANEKEVEVQGELIPSIFERAFEVVVWLGEASDDSKTAIDFIPDLLDLTLIDTLVKEERTPVKWQALINLMDRPYFSRRWMFIELMLAKRCILFCGDDIIDWGNFADAVVILGSRYDDVKLLVRTAVASGQNSKIDSLVDPRSLAAYSIVEASREHFRRQSDGSSLATCNLEMLVSRMPALQSWHPTAVIYALLPLATDRELWTYGESGSALEVFQQFVMHCAYTSKSLDIICRPWAPKTKPGSGHRSTYGSWPKKDKLPSWIPQVSRLPFGEGSKNRTGRKNGDLFVGHANRPYYTTAGGSTATPIFGQLSKSGDRELDGSMTVSGFIVGEIQTLDQRSQDGTLPASWIETFEWPEDDAESPNFVPDHLWRTLVADRGPGGTAAPLWYHQACKHWLIEYPEENITTTLIRDRQHSSMALQFIQRVRSIIWNRALFTTTDVKGRMLFGLAPTEGKPGHKICVLHGCSVPVLLEQVDKHWTLVGECFVYGIMDGEAMQMSEYTSKIQEFLLK